jgi:hypothetical protein
MCLPLHSHIDIIAVTLNANLTVKLATVLLLVWEVSCSDIGPDIYYPEVICDFPHYLQKHSGMATRQLPSTTFQTLYSLYYIITKQLCASEHGRRSGHCSGLPTNKSFPDDGPCAAKTCCKLKNKCKFMDILKHFNNHF